MPIQLSDLKPGDRVLLNCPKARVQPKREAIYCGVSEVPGFPGKFACFQMGVFGEPSLTVVHPDGSSELLPNPSGQMTWMTAFSFDADGRMRDDEGRTVFIEMRVVMGQG